MTLDRRNDCSRSAQRRPRRFFSRHRATAFAVVLAFVAVHSAASSASEGERFSHVVFDSLLQANVAAGRVWYEGFDTAPFRSYLQNLAEAEPSRWSRDERLAFWLNAYNASVIATVLRHPGIAMPANAEGFFTQDSVLLAGKWQTLEEMRDFIRARFKTPLVHFGLTDATKGSPKLAKRAFRAATVGKQLTAQTRQFLRSEIGAVLDVGTTTLRLAKLFERFRADFEAGFDGSGGKPLATFAATYMNDTEAAFIAVHRGDIRVAFFEEDMRLNKRELTGATVEIKPYNKPKSVSARGKKKP